jgi:hypothetical protein
LFLKKGNVRDDFAFFVSFDQLKYHLLAAGRRSPQSTRPFWIWRTRLPGSTIPVVRLKRGTPLLTTDHFYIDKE